jgi:hypothetical protein
MNKKKKRRDAENVAEGVSAEARCLNPVHVCGVLRYVCNWAGIAA